MRGVIALAAAIALPQTLADGSPFPQRNLIVFLAFCVILVTLVLQGLTLPWLVRLLGIADSPRPQRRRGNSAPGDTRNRARLPGRIAPEGRPLNSRHVRRLRRTLSPSSYRRQSEKDAEDSMSAGTSRTPVANFRRTASAGTADRGPPPKSRPHQRRNSAPTRARTRPARGLSRGHREILEAGLLRSFDQRKKYLKTSVSQASKSLGSFLGVFSQSAAPYRAPAQFPLRLPWW